MDAGRLGKIAESHRAIAWEQLRSHTTWVEHKPPSTSRILIFVTTLLLIVVATIALLRDGELTVANGIPFISCVGVLAFAWKPHLGAFILVGTYAAEILGSHNGGSLVSLAFSSVIITATCGLPMIVVYFSVLGGLIVYLDVSTSVLTAEAPFGITTVAIISGLLGVAIRLFIIREPLLAAREKTIARLETLAAEEQERIADELHDGIAHDLTLVLFHARALPLQPDEEARDVSLQTISSSAQRAMESIRSLLAVLRGTNQVLFTELDRDNLVLGDILDSFVTLLRNAKIDVTLTTTLGPSPTFGFDTDRVLAQIALEAVTNILKHAPGSDVVHIRLQKKHTDVELTVSNDVAPLPESPQHASGRGLLRMQQRVNALGGRIEYGATESGWAVTAVVPPSAAPAMSPAQL